VDPWAVGKAQDERMKHRPVLAAFHADREVEGDRITKARPRLDQG
jgi:hypothetical protein